MNNNLQLLHKKIEETFGLKLVKQTEDLEDTTMDAITSTGIIIGSFDIYETKRTSTLKNEMHFGMYQGCFGHHESLNVMRDIVKKFNEEHM